MLMTPMLIASCTIIAGLPEVPISAGDSGAATKDVTVDTTVEATMDATVDAMLDAKGEAPHDARSDARDSAPAEDVPMGTPSVACGPSLECSLATPGNGCCITFTDSGVAPDNYDYTCTDHKDCIEAGGGGLITCDNGKECPNPSDVCCWPSNPVPRVTYCFSADASNCENELCNPDAAEPCRNHPTFVCVPTPDSRLPLSSPGYHLCVPP
jgi:hypothetical protein